MEISNLLPTLLSFGLIGIACLALAEKLIPIPPSYVMLLILGMTTAPDIQALAFVAAATTAGSTAGALCWYGVGWVLGAERVESWIVRYGGYALISPTLYRRLADAYRRNHFGVTLIGQIIPTVRIYLALPAGVLKLRLPAFLVATSLGSLVWNLPLLSLGYGVRHSGYDPATIGFSVVAGLIAMEFAIFLAMRCGLRLMRGIRRKATAVPHG
jgi:membrane protein DedA with SNARE-associated domain